MNDAEALAALIEEQTGLKLHAQTEVDRIIGRTRAEAQRASRRQLERELGVDLGTAKRVIAELLHDSQHGGQPPPFPPEAA